MELLNYHEKTTYSILRHQISRSLCLGPLATTFRAHLFPPCALFALVLAVIAIRTFARVIIPSRSIEFDTKSFFVFVFHLVVIILQILLTNPICQPRTITRLVLHHVQKLKCDLTSDVLIRYTQKYKITANTRECAATPEWVIPFVVLITNLNPGILDTILNVSGFPNT